MCFRNGDSPGGQGRQSTALETGIFGGDMNSKNLSVCQQAGTTCAMRRGMTRGIRGFGWIFPVIAILLMLPSRAAFAQYDTGSLIGVIQDSTGAVIPRSEEHTSELQSQSK